MSDPEVILHADELFDEELRNAPMCPVCCKDGIGKVLRVPGGRTFKDGDDRCEHLQVHHGRRPRVIIDQLSYRPCR